MTGKLDAIASSATRADLLAELRWCDAERRLALRALAEYAPECSLCSRRAVVDEDCNGEAPYEFRCEQHRAHWKPRNPLAHAAQIAAADEEIER